MKLWAFIVLVLFAILSFVGILHHEMWLDEMNWWMAARDSSTYLAYLQNTTYAGHRGIWEVIVYFVSRFTAQPLSIQLLSIGISCLAVFLFLKHAPFSIPFKVAVVFSFFFLYAYNIISRGYNLTWLLLTVFCILFSKEKRNYPLLFTVLVMLACVHLFSLILSMVLFIVFLLSDKRNKKANLLYVLGFAIIAFLIIISILPPEGSIFVNIANGGFWSADRISKTISFLVKGLYPLPDISLPGFWNTNFLVSHFKLLSILLTFCSFIIPGILFYDKPLVLFFYCASIMLIMAALFMLRFFTGVHYMGYSFMILVTALWLSYDSRMKGKTTGIFLSNVRNYTCKPFVWSILLCQVLSGFYVLLADYKRPFSEGKAVAAYIQQANAAKPLVISASLYSGISIAGYLNSSIYYPALNRFGTFVNWVPDYPIPEPEIFRRITHNMDSTKNLNTFITIANDWDGLDSLTTQVKNRFSNGAYSIKEEKQFCNAILKGEDYTVYWIRKND